MRRHAQRRACGDRGDRRHALADGAHVEGLRQVEQRADVVDGEDRRTRLDRRVAAALQRTDAADEVVTGIHHQRGGIERGGAAQGTDHQIVAVARWRHVAEAADRAALATGPGNAQLVHARGVDVDDQRLDLDEWRGHVELFDQRLVQRNALGRVLHDDGVESRVGLNRWRSDSACSGLSASVARWVECTARRSCARPVGGAVGRCGCAGGCAIAVAVEVEPSRVGRSGQAHGRCEHARH